MSCLVPTEASGGDDTHVQDMCVVNLERLTGRYGVIKCYF